MKNARRGGFKKVLGLVKYMSYDLFADARRPGKHGIVYLTLLLMYTMKRFGKIDIYHR